MWLLADWFELDSRLAIWDSVVSNTVLVITLLGLREALLKFMPSMGRFGYTLGVSFLLAFTCLGVVSHILEPLGGENSAYLAFLARALPVRAAFYLFVVASGSMLSLVYARLHEQQEMQRRQADMAVMAREAELQKLQLQLQPHFLFNSLNSINALIHVRPNQARDMVQHLSDFLRLTIRRADEHWITLAEEWSYLQLYLEIEKVRFGHRLVVETSFQEGSQSWKMPTLLLQPLVENAIKFGLYGTTGEVVIRMTVTLTNQLLVINVTNPMDEDSRPAKGSGFGLSGLRRRLYLLFARNDLLETTATNGFFAVTLKIPAPPGATS